MLLDRTRSQTSLFGLALPVLFAVQSLGVPATGGGDGEDERTVITATPREGSIEIDGRLDDSAWDEAEPAGGFVQGRPREGVPAEAPTEVRVVVGERAIYFGARMHDPAPETIARQVVRRDEWGQYDYFEVALDPNLDRRTGYSFRVTAAGVQGDAYLYDDVENDRSWDAVWESAVHYDDEGWTAELRIPLSQIRYEPTETAQTWGINFYRRRLASNERTYFVLESRERHGRVSVFGRLRGVTVSEPVGRTEIRPYVLSSVRSAPQDPHDPFAEPTEFDANAGVDVRYGLGPAFSLDLTLNPDFGQVEVDPAVINLSDRETYFDERRPFFVEDARIFDFGLSGRRNRVFYSRRVGRAPQGRPPKDADAIDMPAATTILGAAKLTGRTSGGLSLGALAAVTGEESGRAHIAEDGTVEPFVAEPRTQYGVVRGRQDLRDGRLQVGAIATALHRQLPANGSFDHLTSEAFGAGIDFEHTWQDRTWALWGFLAGSLVRGDTTALTRLQHGSTHYFQRPDATRLGVDSAATALTGAEWRLEFERRSGRHWTGAVWLGQRTPGFDVNDLGYLRGGERLDAGARVTYQEISPGDLLRDYRISLWTFHNWRHQALDSLYSPRSWRRAHSSGALSLSTDVTFLNYWKLNVNARYYPETLDGGATRGGPLMLDPAGYALRINGRTDRRNALSVGPSVNIEDSGPGGSSIRAGLDISIRPSPRWEMALGPSYNREYDAAQYVATTPDMGYAATYGRRYLFGDLRRESLSVDTRLNVAFTPTLSLQLYAQPLLSAGDFTRYKQLERAEGFEFDALEPGATAERDGEIRCLDGRICTRGDRRHVDFDGDGVPEFAFADRNFNVRSLRGNAVLRWEYRPGSTLFLVWQQSRSGRGAAGDLDVGRDAGALAAQEPENVLILKANYWTDL